MASALATAAATGSQVNGSTLVDALRTGAELQQGTASHGPDGDAVQLLSAAVEGGGAQAAGEVAGGTSLQALSAPADASASLLATTAAAQRSTGSPSSPDTLLLLTTAGAALALAGTALETARRQRVRAAVARGRGRRALR